MNETELMLKLEEAKNDADFIEKLFEQETPEKIQEVFAEKGIILAIEDVKSLIVNVVDTLEKKVEEVDEATLDNVSGGFVVTSAMIGWGCAALMAAGGMAIGWKLAKGKC